MEGLLFQLDRVAEEELLNLSDDIMVKIIDVPASADL
jgi:hypothetical protein